MVYFCIKAVMALECIVNSSSQPTGHMDYPGACIAYANILHQVNHNEGFPGDSAVKYLPAMQETCVQYLGQEDPLEKEMTTHSSILAWRILWTEDRGGRQSLGSQRVGNDWATLHTQAAPVQSILLALCTPLMARHHTSGLLLVISLTLPSCSGTLSLSNRPGTQGFGTWLPCQSDISSEPQDDDCILHLNSQSQAVHVWAFSYWKMKDMGKCSTGTALKRRRGQQTMRCLDGVTDWMDMRLHKLREMVKDNEPWCAAFHGVTVSWTWLSGWTTTAPSVCPKLFELLQQSSVSWVAYKQETFVFLMVLEARSPRSRPSRSEIWWGPPES